MQPSADDLAGVARQALATAIRSPAASPIAQVGDTDRLRRPGPVFVTVVLAGATRACQGTLRATTGSLAAEIAAAAGRAARGDTRHPSLTLAELERAHVIVSLPYDVQPLARGRTLDPRTFGLAVETARGAGVLLPGEARTFDWMLRETRRRAGATAQDPGRMYFFRTQVIGELKLPPLEPR